MTVLAVLTTDGRRDCIRRALASLEANVTATNVSRRMIFVDSDADYMRWLTTEFPDWWVHPTGDKAGYAAAMHVAFMWLDDVLPSDERVFWCEDDFTFNRPVDLDAMGRVMDRRPHLAQLALRRQPWNDAERAAGGIIEQHPDWYTEITDDELGAAWLEHTGYFTNNPNLMQRWVLASPYPLGRDAEGRFTFALKDREPAAVFGYWGARDSGEAVSHIGDVRVGGAY